MKNTKAKILASALALFNEHGYYKVTIRMIAQAAGMSSGNLNYHFTTKVEILSALYFEMAEHFDARVDALAQAELDLRYVYVNIQTSMERMLVYRFIWTDLFNLLREEEALRTHFQAVYQNRLKGYAFLFDALIQLKTLKTPSYPTEYQELAIKMVHLGNTWINALSLYNSKLKQVNVPYHAKLLLGMLYPYLTEAGQKTFELLD